MPFSAVICGRLCRHLPNGSLAARIFTATNGNHHHHRPITIDSPLHAACLSTTTSTVASNNNQSTFSVNNSYRSSSSTQSTHNLPPAPYISRRTLLYVPGDDVRKLRKATQLQCDFIALDCEDGVAVSRKQFARDTIRSFYDSNLNEVPSKHEHCYRNAEWSVRLNSWSSGLCEDDLRAVTAGKRVPETLLLPKCENAEELEEFSDALRRHCNSAALQHRIALIMYAESCTAIMNLPAICSAAMSIAQRPDSLFDVAGLVFGSDDFCASMGATRTADSTEILYARQRCVLIAKAFGLQAIDMVHIDYKDAAGLRAQAEFGARMGYTGKQVIHPAQIDAVQAAFVPSAERVDWARGLLRAFEEHQHEGKGAFVYRNQMIDMPTMRQAQNVMDTVANLKGGDVAEPTD